MGKESLKRYVKKLVGCLVINEHQVVLPRLLGEEEVDEIDSLCSARQIKIGHIACLYIRDSVQINVGVSDMFFTAVCSVDISLSADNVSGSGSN